MGRERREKLAGPSACSSPFLPLANAGEGARGGCLPQPPPPHSLGSGLRSPLKKVSSGLLEPWGSVRSSSWVGPRAHVSVFHAHLRSRLLGGRLGRGAAPGSPVLSRGSPVALIHGSALPSLGRSTFRLLWRNAWCGVRGPLFAAGEGALWGVAGGLRHIRQEVKGSLDYAGGQTPSFPSNLSNQAEVDILDTRGLA